MANEDPWSRLLTAQEKALAHVGRVDDLVLDPIRKGVPSLPVESRLVSAQATLTMEGASSLTLGFSDPTWAIERSGLLRVGSAGRLTALRVVVDGLAWRLVKASRQDPKELELTFEDEAAVLLRQHNKPMAASRGSVTRAQFIQKMVREVRVRDIPFYSPEKGVRQPKRRADFPDAEPPKGARETGFDEGASFKIKGKKADASQMRNVATSLTVADQLGAKGRARLAMMCAGIGESEFRAIMNQAGSPYGGVFQGNVRGGVFKLDDTEGQARCFLKGGKGFQAGGAMAAAKNHPEWSPGEIALHVEGSRSNFATYSDAVQHYQKHAPEGRKILAAWGSGDGADSDPVLYAKSYQFTRGDGDKRETSWDAAARLGDEVRWRFFAAGGAVAFVSDDYLITKPASAVIDGFDGQGSVELLEPPRYDWDHGKPVTDVDLKVNADRWAVGPGMVYALRNMGPPVDGRWIVHNVDIDLLDPTKMSVTLIKPLAPLKEPAPELSGRKTRQDDDAPRSNQTPSAGGFIKPVKGATMSSPFGPRWGRLHDGIDYAVAVGTPVYAVRDGKVKVAGSYGGYGIYVEIDHDDGLKTFYGHLSTLKVRAGEKVKQGEQIATSGNTGRSTGPHLHFGVHRLGQPVDPQRYLS